MRISENQNQLNSNTILFFICPEWTKCFWTHKMHRGWKALRDRTGRKNEICPTHRKIQNQNAFQCRAWNKWLSKFSLSKIVPWLTAISEVCSGTKYIIRQAEQHSRFSVKLNDSSQVWFWPNINSTTSTNKSYVPLKVYFSQRSSEHLLPTNLKQALKPTNNARRPAEMGRL